MAQSGDRSPTARLGLLDATMVGMGAMIGAGIFVLTGLAAEIAGPAAILVFALNGVVTVLTGISYAELASAIPKSGGGYVFVREVFSGPTSFLMGWMLSFAYMIAGALYALGFSSNFVEFVHLYWAGLPTGPVWHILYALTVVGLFALLNAVSTEASGGAETVVTIIKIIILLVFAGFGAFAVEGSNFEPFFAKDDSSVAILKAMGLTFIAFEGYDLIATVTEEVENPRENIPKAIFISLVATVAIYLIVVWVAIGTLGAEELGRAGETGIAEAATSFMPTIPLLGEGAALIVFGAVFSTVSALNAVVIASSRVVFAMGREDQLPNPLGQISARFGTPLAAVVVSAAVMLGSVVFLPIEQVGRVSSLFFLVSFVVVNWSVIRLRNRRPNMRRPFEMPFYPAIPILAIVLNLVLAYFLLRDDPYTLVLGVGWIAIGGLVYAALQWRRTETEAAGA
ncbi:amino acid transporter [Salinibacter ruber]|uniref:Cationic amino acid transporter n=3 Tax=Salinibacter ruber TaxID=146919 RepID=Q2S0B3_SALRD|nr:APC family permease [Salinibacter ruber]ABC44396.1 cationic amino acid transporter [Salinibacter ruber DSM 13855]MBB4068906.1 amino acid transporter [Salinibacter ruber]MBB4088500.1 amino acid transporter [Salinibacter ruber]MCS3662561.1 amino acid transporter [Salinibacter ruber]MCS3670804.1 amino acid transporter [Salinibacter ruber]